MAHKVHRLAGCFATVEQVKIAMGCSDSAIQGELLAHDFAKETLCVEGMLLSSSRITQEESQPTSNWRQVDACVGVLILFAGLRRPNSIKDWLVRLGDRYKVDVNVQDYDIMNGPEQDLVNDMVARKVQQSIVKRSS